MNRRGGGPHAARSDRHKPDRYLAEYVITNLATGVRAFTSNAFLVPGDRPVLVDVGADFDLVGRLRDAGVDPAAVVLTHTHSDHVGNLQPIVDAFDVEVWGHDADREGVDRAIADGDRVRFGDHAYEALHTPGHKNDHLCFYGEEPAVLFAGDLVFGNGSFGRTDLPEGDRAALIESIDYVRDSIDEELREMHVGHGPSVTQNPYAHVELAATAARQF